MVQAIRVAHALAVFVGVVISVWVCYIVGTAAAIKTNPELFTDYLVDTGVYLVAGNCYAPVLNEVTVEPFQRCIEQH